jgi:hypothetical protein
MIGVGLQRGAARRASRGPGPCSADFSQRAGAPDVTPFHAPSSPTARPARSRQPRLNVLTLRPILPDMPRKPQQPPQPTKTKWHVYKLAAKRQWVGEIEAVDEREALEIAAKSRCASKRRVGKWQPDATNRFSR